MVKVEIITIGDEILIGQIVDTNSAWMGAELSKAGFDVVQITSVHDASEQITQALKLALERADAVLITGGIGPTKDDVTKNTLCTFFNTRLVFDESVFAHIEELLKNRSRAMNELTKSQAMVPESCTVIPNLMGTAPITWFDEEQKVVVSMPGVPYEMKNVMTLEILPRLKQRFHLPTIIHQTVLVAGYPESALALKIQEWEDALPEDIRLAYLPNYGIVKLRLTGNSYDAVQLDAEMKQCMAALCEILGDAIIAYQDLPLEQLIGVLLSHENKTLATAESCTGGQIAQRITSVPGSSAYFKGSVVAYSNEIKTGLLNVDADDLQNYGAVSRQVVEQMAVNVREMFGVDFSVATSGIAGPGGGTPDKPVGMVWIAVSSAEKLVSREFQFNLSREQNIERSTQSALLMLKEIIEYK